MFIFFLQVFRFPLILNRCESNTGQSKSCKHKCKCNSQTLAQYWKRNSSHDDPANKYEAKKIVKKTRDSANLQCLSARGSLSDSGPVSLPTHLPNSYLPKEPPPRATESLSSMTLPLRGPLGNSSGSPHLGNMMHPPMPPSCIMEELQRAFASKNRQER